MQTAETTQRSGLRVLHLRLRQDRLRHPTIEVEKGLLLLPALHRHWLLSHAQPAATAHVGRLLHPQIRPRLRGWLARKDWPLLLIWQHLLVEKLLTSLHLRGLCIQATSQVCKLLCLRL